MRRRLAFLLVLCSVAAGCSLLVEFDRGKLGSLADIDASNDAIAPDATGDAPSADGSSDAPTPDAAVDASGDAADAGTDAPLDAPGDGPADAPSDAPADTATDAPADAGSDAVADASDAAADAADAADAGEISAYCTQAEFDGNDLTGNATATVTFPLSVGPSQYSPNCLKVSTGTTVTFQGSFANHPLVRSLSGTAGSPIPATTITASDGGAEGDLDVTFNAAGEFDYECGNHPVQMFGSVQVVP